ncbi:hypothetical protein D3C86_1656730 [compost metagenome]
MEIEDVDVVGAEIAQRVLDCLIDPLARVAAEVRTLLVRIDELCRQHPVIPVSLDAAPDHLFRLAVVIDVGGIDEVDALLARLVDDAEGDVIRRLVAEHHGPQRQRRHLEGTAPEIAILNHSKSPFQLMLSAKWQATSWPGAMKRNSGSAARQRSVANGHRVWNRQPEGMLLGLGRSPPSGAAWRGRDGSGTTSISARV